MQKIYTYARNIQVKPKYLTGVQNLIRGFSNEKDPKKPKIKADSAAMDEKTKKSQESLKKLNDLLKNIIENEPKPTASKLVLARPKEKKAPKVKEEQPPEPEVLKILSSVREVAETIGGNTKQIESELLTKLLSTETETPTEPSSLSDIIKGMKIDRSTKAPKIETRSQQVRNILDRVQNNKERQFTPKSDQARKPFVRRTQNVQQTQRPTERIDLFGGPSLGIFTNPSELIETSFNKTWQTLNEREMRLSVTHPPSNYFQELIQWTEQGKLWKFPIDNEQGMETEKNVYFAEHVFMEKHLEPWCPQKGPIRHFMELVCVGLSKNHYLTVEAKKEHIDWFKNYFEDKKQLLKEIGAISANDLQNKGGNNQIEGA